MRPNSWSFVNPWNDFAIEKIHSYFAHDVKQKK